MTEEKEEINFQAWEKIDIRVGKIVKAEEIPGADKLYKLEVDLGKELGKRVVCAGIKQHYSKEQLKNKKCVFLVNLEPRVMKGVKSDGMILAAVSDSGEIKLVIPDDNIELGSKIR